MLIDPAEQILLCIKNIQQLRQVLVECDPASGVSIAVRRGVWRNTDEERPDRRPISICEMSDLVVAKTIVRQCIEQQIRLLEVWVKAAEEQKQALDQAMLKASEYDQKEKLP